MKRCIALILLAIILVGCGNASNNNETLDDTSVVFDSISGEEFAGTYIGLHGSGITLFSTGGAEYYWKEWQNVETGDTWEYKDNKIVFHSRSLGYDIYADVEENNISTLTFKSVDESTWQDEIFVKISSDIESKDVVSYKELIEKQLNISLDEGNSAGVKIETASGFSFECPENYIKNDSDDKLLSYIDETNDQGLIVPKVILDDELSESDKQKLREQLVEYIDWNLSKLVNGYGDGKTLESDGVSIINISNDQLITKTAKLDDDYYDTYVTIFLDIDSSSRFFSVFMAKKGDVNAEDEYKKIVKSVRYIGGDSKSSGSTNLETKENNTENVNNAGVSTDLKEFLDSYASFMDEYVEFMKKYKENPTDMTLITGYAEMLQKYSEFAATAEKYDTNEMSTEDAKYYLDVMNRINKKLLEVAG